MPRPPADFARAGGIQSSRAVRFRPPHVRGRTARDVGWRCIGRMEPRGAARCSGRASRNCRRLHLAGSGSA